ncbi:MAG: class I SAM-dependent methyltransferase [Dorea sp.]|nr:class I SAM-dependent methyltransferase [Dorea sp.]
MRYILYGASKYMQDLIDEDLIQHVDYIVDKSEELAGKEYLGREIKRPDVLPEENKDDVFIVITAFGQLYSIEYDLRQMGFERGKHFEWIGRMYNHYPNHSVWWKCRKSKYWKEDEGAWRQKYQNEVPHERAELVAKMIDWTRAESVLDLGSGSEPMRPLLPEGVAYYPVDYKQLTGNTLVFDFNQKQFPEIEADVVILVGVSGYVDYEVWLIEQAVRAVKSGGQLVISFNYCTGNYNAFDFITKYHNVMQCVDYAFRSETYGIFLFKKTDC